MYKTGLGVFWKPNNNLKVESHYPNIFMKKSDGTLSQYLIKYIVTIQTDHSKKVVSLSNKRTNSKAEVQTLLAATWLPKALIKSENSLNESCPSWL